MIELNYRDGRPIYEQVKDALRRMVVTGAIAPGDKLPSVRQMASSLAINPNTIQRAYEELEHEGYVYSVPGKGSFAAHRTEMDDSRRQALLVQLDGILEELRFFGLTAEELAGRYRRLCGEGGDGAARGGEEEK